MNRMTFGCKEARPKYCSVVHVALPVGKRHQLNMLLTFRISEMFSEVSSLDVLEENHDAPSVGVRVRTQDCVGMSYVIHMIKRMDFISYKCVYEYITYL
jgi:hypothetical protein